MDKKRSALNVIVSVIAKILLLVFSFVLKICLVRYVGNEANGVYSLYTSIFSFMALAELGIGTAISFTMYKPIVNGEYEKVSALYQLLKRVYFVIGIAIFTLGLLMMPLLPILAKGHSYSFNLYITFGMMLVSVVLEYLFTCKTTLINAYKNNYITTIISSVAIFIRRIIQLFVLICLRSFEWYIAAKIIGVLIQWLLTEIYTHKHYSSIITTKVKIDGVTKASVIKNTRAIFMHKVGGVLVNATDNIIISAIIGVAVLGLYSNYLLIMTSMTSILTMFFTPLTSVIGHLCAEDDVQEAKKYFKFMYFLNFTIGIIFYLGYYAVAKNVVGIFFGEQYTMNKWIPLIITINYFIQFMRQSVLLFRDATGSFYYDRWKPIIAGIANVVLSVALVYICGVVGVILATSIINLLVSDIVEPYVLYKHGFKGESPKKYYILSYFLIAVFIACIFVLDLLMQNNASQIIESVINGFIAVGIALIPTVALLFNRTYRGNLIKLFSKTKNLFTKKKTDIINREDKE